MFLHPLASRTPTAWPILKLLLMARIIPSTLPDLGSGASLFENIQKNFLHTNLVYLSVPTILISPWVGKAVIEHEGTNNGRTYTHSSIAGFISKARAFYLLIIFLITDGLLRLLALESRQRSPLDTTCGFRVYLRASHYEQFPWWHSTHPSGP